MTRKYICIWKNLWVLPFFSPSNKSSWDDIISSSSSSTDSETWEWSMAWTLSSLPSLLWGTKALLELTSGLKRTREHEREWTLNSTNKTWYQNIHSMHFWSASYLLNLSSWLSDAPEELFNPAEEHKKGKLRMPVKLNDKSSASICTGDLDLPWLVVFWLSAGWRLAGVPSTSSSPLSIFCFSIFNPWLSDSSRRPNWDIPSDHIKKRKRTLLRP